MESADAVLMAIPTTYFVTVVALAPLGVDLTVALGFASTIACALVGHVLFVDPPR